MDIAVIARDVVMVLVPMILSLSVHEWAHAWSAHKLGDDTAYSQGRMTLNPLAHIDLIGTIVIPVFSVINGGFSLIGWAKPVPVSPYRFRRDISMRNGMIITALAGPASNLILALAVGGVAMFLYSEQIDKIMSFRDVDDHVTALLLLGSEEYAEKLQEFDIESATPMMVLFSRFFLLNVGLAVFNMLPVPPLDGSRVLPLRWQEKLSRYTLVVFFGFIILINVGANVLWYVIAPIGNLLLGFWSLIF